MWKEFIKTPNYLEYQSYSGRVQVIGEWYTLFQLCFPDTLSHIYLISPCLSVNPFASVSL